MRLICEFVRQNPGMPLSLIDMEHMTGYSNRSLRNEFYREFGLSPVAWQQRERLILARNSIFLDKGNVTVKDMAGRFGFVSTSRFIAYYKRLFNETPRETIGKAKNNHLTPAYIEGERGHVIPAE